MFSAVCRKAAGDGRFLTTRADGSDGGFRPAVAKYDLAVSYTIHPENGQDDVVVSSWFPSGKYSALSQEPSRSGYWFSGWRTSPLPYDAEVEYIEAVDGQWIDTLCGVTADTRIDASWRQIGVGVQQRLFGVNDGSNKVFALYINNNGKWAVNAGTSSGGVIGGDVLPNTDYTGTFDLAIGFCKINALSATFAGTPFSSSNTIPIFQRRNVGVVQTSYPATMRLYSLQIRRDDFLVRDLTPVRVGTEGYLYDRANPTGGPNGNGLYGNSGTGAFTLGPDVSSVSSEVKATDLVVPDSHVYAVWRGPVPVVFDAEDLA